MSSSLINNNDTSNNNMIISSNKKKKLEIEESNRTPDEYYDVDTNRDDSRKSKTNSFRYQSFSEKISKVDINIFNKKVGDVLIELEDDNDSYFHQTILIWRELNLTQHYNNFFIHIRKYHDSLPEIIIHKDKIIDILLQHISIKNSTALKPLLSCLSSLSRDLRSEFYDSFFKVLKVLITVLKNSFQSETIEEVFTSICYIFKFLEKQILPNFTQLYEIYSELFLQKRKYIRKFAAESIAFFLRKITFEEFDSTLNYLFGELNSNCDSEEYVDSFSILLFHSVKGVKGKFHSRTEHILPLILRKLDSSNLKVCSTERKFYVLVRLFQLIKHHGVNEGDNLLPIWLTLKSESSNILDSIKKVQTTSTSSKSELSNLSSQIEAYFNIIKDWMYGGKIMNMDDLFFILSKFFSNSTIMKTIIENEFNSSSLLIVLAKAFPIAMRRDGSSSNGSSNNKEMMLGYLDNLFSLQGVKNSHLLIFQFCTSINKSNITDLVISNRLVKYLDKNASSLDINEMLTFLIRVFAMNENDEPISISLLPSFEIVNLSKKVESLLNNFNENFKNLESTSNFNFGGLWAIISTCLILHTKSSNTLLPIIEKTINLLELKLSSTTAGSESADTLIYLLSHTLSAYSILLSKYSPSSSQLPQLSSKIFKLISNYSNNINVLKLTSIYFEKLNEHVIQVQPTTTTTTKPATKKSNTKSTTTTTTKSNDIIEPINIEIFKNYSQLLKSNLTSKSNSIRKETVTTLKYLHLCSIKNIETTASEAEQEEKESIQKFFDNCIEIETTQYHLREARGVVSKIDGIGSIFSNGKVSFMNELIYNYMMGALYIRFTPLWSAIQKNILLFCKKDVVKFYPILYKTLQLSEQSLLDLNKDKMVIDKEDGEDEEIEEIIEDEEDEEDEKETTTDEIIDENANIEDENDDDEEIEKQILSFEKLMIKDKLNLNYLYNEIIEKLNLENSEFVEKSAKNILLCSTDPINYNSTLWKTMSMIGSLVEGQSKDLISMFLDFICNDFNRFTKVFKNSSNGSAFEFGNTVVARSTVKPYSKSQAEQLMIYYLEFFSQFKRPTKMFQEKLMQQLFYRCLDIDQPKIQFQALQCYLLWSSPSIVPYKKNLERLINDKTMREEMTTFIISKDSPNSSISNDHRLEIVDIVIKILLSKLNRKVTRSNINAQRITIFAYFSGLSSKELEPIIKKLIFPFEPLLLANSNNNSSSTITTTTKSTVNKKSKQQQPQQPKEKDEDLTLLPPMDTQVYFLNILQSAIKQLGSLLVSSMDQIVSILLLISKNTITTTVVNSNDKRPKIISSIRSLAFRRFSEIIQQYHEWDFKNYIEKLFKIFSTILPTFNAYGLPVGLRRCLLVVSSNPKLVGYLNQDITLLPTILSFITYKPHQDAFLSIIENLLLNVDPNEAEPNVVEIYMKVLLPHIDSIINAVKSILLRSKPIKKQDNTTAEDDETTSTTSTTTKKHSLNPSKLSKRHLAILAEVSKFAKSSDQASELLELLIPFLRFNKLGDDDDLVLSILLIFKNMIAIIQHPDDHIPTLSTLFGVFKTRITRTTLSEIFLVLGEKVDYMKSISPYLEKLNAYTKKSVHLETYDYDKRLSAYQYINDNLLETLGHRELLPLFINYVFYIKDKDYSIKNSATSGLSRLIKSISLKLNENGEPLDASDINTIEILNQFKSIFIQSMRTNFNDKDVRDDYLLLFNQLLSEWKGCKQFYPDLQPLLFNGDGDKNFFLNYCHIQKHRKRLSFLQLKNYCSTTIQGQASKLSIESINQIILPLSIQAILETSIKDHGSAILGEVVKSLGVLAKSLEWKGYYQVLRKLISTMDLHPSRFKFFVKSVCEVIDEFHFFINETDVRNELLTGSEIKENDSTTTSTDKQQQQQDDESDDDEDEEDEEENEELRELREIENDQNNLVTEYNEDDQEENGVLKVSKTKAHSTIKLRKKKTIGATIVKTKNISEDIFQAITTVLTPSLKKHLVEIKVITSSKMDTGSAAQAEKQKQEGVVNLSIALAILKLYKLLPETTSRLLYPNIIGKLCIGLKSKEYEVRDTTRNTLVQVMETLGYRFFPYILKDMRNILKSGYQKHILAYTLHALLNTLSKTIEVGVLDSQVSLLMDIIIEDLFGEPSVQREIKHIQDTYPEAKSQRSFDTLRIIANIIHYSNCNYIIKPIEEVINVSNSPKLLPNLEEMMKKISKGLRFNKSLDFKNLAIITYQFITKGLRDKEINTSSKKAITIDTTIGVGHKPTYEETFSIQADPRKKKNERIYQQETHFFIFTELGFSLLIQAIKIQKSTDLAQYVSMIDPFVAYISKCLEHKQSRVVYLSLKCLHKIFSLDLPSVKTLSQQLTIQVLKRLQMDSGNVKISNTCYEIATCFLRDTKQEHVNEEQLKAILSLTREHLTSGEQNLTRSLNMVHALISRKVLLPEIYDLMDLCSSMMIRSHQPAIASLISNILIDFLLFYPMGEARLKQQITFLVKNLTYDYEDGRLIVLKTLKEIVIRFPQEVLNQYAMIIYVPLVVRLTADSSVSCRAAVAELIQLLVKGVSVQISTKIYDMTMLWFENGSKNIAMARTSAQIIGLFSEGSCITNYESKISSIVAKSTPFIKQSLNSLREKEQSFTIIDEIEGDALTTTQALPDWQLTYSIFTAFEKILTNYPKATISPDLTEFWSLTIQFLNYPHIWVRSSITRLYNIFFTQQSILNLIPIIDQLSIVNNNTISSSKKKSTTTNTTISPVYKSIFNSNSIFEITKKHCSILNSRLLTDELGLTIVKNLIYLSMLFYKCKNIQPPTNNKDDITPNIFINNDSIDNNQDDDDEEMNQDEEVEQEDDGEEADAAEVDEESDVAKVEEQPMEEDGEEIEEDIIQEDEEQPKQESSMLLWVFKRLSYMSTKPGLLRRKYIFRWIAAVSTQLTVQELMPYLSILLIPLIKCTDEKIRATPQERKLAQEVIDILKKKIGASKFMTTYQAIIKATNELREKRRADRKIEAVANPKEFLQKKQEKRQLTKDKKRRHKRESIKELFDDRKRIRVSQHLIHNEDD